MVFSVVSYVNYVNDQIENKETAVSQAFRKDVKAAIALAGYPTKDEIDIIDTVEGLKMSNTAAVIPELVGNFMKDTDRNFEIPAVDDNTTATVIGRVHKDETTKEGVSVIGGERKEWKSTIAAHTEYFAKNKRKPFVVQ